MRAVRYAFDEAVASLWRGRRSGLLAVVTIAVALFVLGAFLLLTANLQRVGAEWEQTAEVSVYLSDGIGEGERAGIERLLAQADGAASFEFVTKEEAARRFKMTFAELAGTLDTLGDNPLPASYEVRVAARKQPSTLLDSLRRSPGVVDVRYDREWLERALSWITVVRAVGLLFHTVLAFAAALTVANVVRLALFARRDEIEIMQLVGAPRAFVRGPFLMEGLLQGAIGALAALAALAVVFLLINARYVTPAAGAQVWTLRFLPVGWCGALLVGGMSVGCLGGSAAAAGRT